MHMDVVDSTFLQKHGVICAQPGVQQGLQSTLWRFPPLQKDPRHQASNPLPTPHGEPERSQESQHLNRLQTENLQPRLCTCCSSQGWVRSAYAARNNLHSAAPQLLDFLANIRLYGCGKSIGEIGDRQHSVALRGWGLGSGAVSCLERRTSLFQFIRCTPPLRRQHSRHGEQKSVHKLIIHHHQAAFTQ